MLPMKLVRSSLAALFLVASFSFISPSAVAVNVVTPPQLLYSDNSGLNFRAVAAKLTPATKSSYQWFVNGKAISGATKLTFKASVKQKNQTIQFKESFSGASTQSVIAKISEVIVNLKPVVTFTDATKTTVSASPALVSPQSAKAVLQWYKGPIDIAGAKKSLYTPATSDQGFKIYLNATYSFKGFTTIKIDSNEVEIPLMNRVYSQVWSEEFNQTAGSAPDTSVWLPENGDGSKTVAGGGWGNRERQYYIPTLAKITSAGALQIDATTTGAGEYACYYKGGCEWISSKYITKGKVAFKYGRMEARIKGPVGAGTWGAFWMLGADIDERLWPWCGEIDVTELVGKSPNASYGYLHGLLSGGAGGRGTTVDMPNGFANEYHTYSIDWLPDQINWYLDGVLYGSQPKIDKDWVFDHEFYLIMNLAMGGNLGGGVEAGLKQATMSFDWIRFSTINGIGEVIKY